MQKDAYSVLIVEDIKNTRLRFEQIIEQSPDLQLAGSAENVADGRKLLQTQNPDILLVDLGLPDGNGKELIEEISKQQRNTLAMVITVFGDERHVVSALEAGAMGYLLKDDEFENIIESIKQLIAGGSPISPPIAKHMLKRFHSKDKPPDSNPKKSIRLTEREQEVLLMVSKGYTSTEIADSMSVSYNTITTHVRNIYKKLAVNNRAEAVIEAIQMGIINHSGNDQ